MRLLNLAAALAAALLGAAGAQAQDRAVPQSRAQVQLSYAAVVKEAAPDQPIEFRQSNREYEIIEWVHEAIDNGAGIIINPAAFTFTSMAIMDSLKMFSGPIIELHISNIHRREPIYHRSYVSPVATAVIAGLGTNGYLVAVRAMRDLVALRVV